MKLMVEQKYILRPDDLPDRGEEIRRGATHKPDSQQSFAAPFSQQRVKTESSISGTGI